jgi:hypothetical protein
MSIPSKLKELESINQEIKRLNINKKKIMTRKKELEEFVIEYLEKNEQKGIRYKGTLIMTSEKTTRPRKKDLEKKSDCEKILKKYGITNCNTILGELNNAMKGEARIKKGIKLSKYN